MKKTVMLMAMVIAFGTVFAGPVDVNTAKMVGQKFAQTTLEIPGADLDLVYTVNTERGDAGMYVFNVGSEGFVIVSADDNFRPVVGYSNEGTFNPDRISPEMLFYMKAIANGRIQAKQAEDRAAEEWQSVMKYGRPLSFNNGRGVPYLVQTKWDQSPAPYNSLCPEDPASPHSGYRAYTGCVATAMSQLMKYWNYPTQGQGSTSYTCNANPAAGYAGHPEYGVQSANFGATTYDWDNMLNSYTSSYSPEQGEAVATICYHCGVAVHMMYGGDADDGSGAFTDDVPVAIRNYFKYSNAANVVNYNGNLTNWKNTLKEQFDLGWPVYYAGSSSEGGHAFICDGYNDADYFHFNWGWGGSDNNYFLISEIDYQSSMRLIVNFVPTDIYNNTAQPPTNVNVVKTSDVAQEATISWTNPTKTLSNVNLTSINQMVVERDGHVIATLDNAAPGAAMSYVDTEVPCYSTFEYRVYAVVEGARGKASAASESFGPTCEWKIIATTTNMTGWKGGALVAYDGAGREIDQFTMTSNNPATYNMNLTLGRVSFAWKPGTDNVALTIKIKDASNTVVYEYSGTSNDIPEGVLYACNNGCGNAAPTVAPGELFASQDGDNVILSWSGAKTDYGFNIYRDGYLFELTHNTEFVDEDPGMGGHCYQVCYLTDGGESPLSNEACATVGEGCESGRNLWYELQSSGKPTITWEAPENVAGVQGGFYVYRKVNEDGEYERVKLLNFNKTEYKENKPMEDGNWYYYKVIPYYQAIDCYSAPIKSMYGNEYFVKVYYSVTGVNELASGVNLYPNPTRDSFTIEGEALQYVMVYNALGQLILSQECQGESAVINLVNAEAGIYMVKVVTADGESIQKVSVIK